MMRKEAVPLFVLLTSILILVVLKSCNGLLLCCSDVGAERYRKYYVFNPTTKQFALIPSVPGAGDVGRTVYAMGLAFHQTDCARYKVVIFIVKLGDERLYQIQTYSSDTGRWKISHKSLSTFYDEFCYGVYCNQAIYWHQHRRYFNLKTEKVQLMPTPEGLRCLQNRRGYFGESRGHLHFAMRSDYHDRHIHVKVYEMLNDNSGWFLKYQVELHELLNAYPEIIRTWYNFEVLDVVRGEEEDETFMVIQIPEKVIKYNVAGKTFKQIYKLSKSAQGLILNDKVHRYIATIDSF